jgi:iron complex outermembrane receptor protein
MKPFALRFPACAVLAAIASPLWAQTGTTTLDEVLVTAPRPDTQLLNATTLGSADIDSSSAATSDTASLLRDIPGVSLYGAGGVSSLPAIHGLADDRLRIKVDGMDLIAACPNHMNSPLSYIDPTRVDSVSVYAGIAPVSVGGDSIGGTILVDSPKPVFAQPGAGMLTTGEVGGFYRSNGNAKGANAAITLASDRLSLTYTGSTAESDNYEAADDFKSDLYVDPANSAYTGRAGHTLDLDEVGSTAYKSINQALDIAYRNGNHLFDLKLATQHIPYENYPNQRMDMTDNESDKINLGYTGQFDWGLLKARAYHEKTEHEMDFGDDKRYWYGNDSATPPLSAQATVNPIPCSPISPTCAAGMPMYTESSTDGLSLNAEIPLSERDTLRLGGDFQAYDLDDWWPASGASMWPNTFWNINDGERDRYAVFGEWEARFSPRWTSLLGVRHETVKTDAGEVQGYNSGTNGMAPMTHYQLRDSTAFNAADRSKTDHNWDLTALARYTPDDSQTYELGVAQKTRSPNLYERYAWSTWQMAALMNNFVGDGNGYVGNLDLDPEVAHTLSLAADWHAADKKAWGLRIAPYYTRVKDYIDAVQWDAATNTARTTPVRDQYTVHKYVNQEARLYGVDLSAYALVAGNTAYGDFTLTGLLNYVDGENRDTDDNLYNIMPLNGKLALTQAWGNWTNTLEGQFVDAKNEVSEVRNEIRTSGYSLVHLRSSYAWKQVRLDFGVENLFDKAYDLPLGGAYLGQGTTMTTSAAGVVPQWGTAVPGSGRSFYVGLSYKF